MRTPARLATIAGLALAALALVGAPASASSIDRPEAHGGHAVFVQTDGSGGNSIVAYDRAADGSLTQVGVYPTGGLGGALDGAVVDKTASQGALAFDRDHRLLYAVNPGSDTVTVFGVHGDRLSRRQLVASGGTFPVSIAVRGNLVYVLNARDGGSVQGYVRVGDRLVRVPAWHRNLGLDVSLTPEFTHTPGQVAFTPDGSKLIVTTKANGNNIDVFVVGRFGGLSAEPVVNADPGAVPFAVTFDVRGHLVVAEAGTNAVATFSVHRDGTAALISRTATGQAATCWIVAAGRNLYASNAGSASLSGYHDNGSGTLTALGNTPTDPGTVDAAASADGRFLYAQTGRNGIVDGFRIDRDGSLTGTGSVTVPDGVAGEGIAVA